MVTLYGIKNCDTIKKPDAGWRNAVLSTASMIIALTVWTTHSCSLLSMS